jgi:hypothetical protein
MRIGVILLGEVKGIDRNAHHHSFADVDAIESYVLITFALQSRRQI